MITRQANITARLDIEYQIQEATKASRLVLLLHGYAESGSKMFLDCEPAFPENAIVIAPNAPFPVPRKIEGVYKLGFSWYFYDQTTDEYLLHPEISVGFLRQFIQNLKLEHLPLTIVGFSQGGYLAPFLGQEIPNTRQVVGIACEYLKDELQPHIDFRVDGIHGSNDRIVNPDHAGKSHEGLIQQGVAGEFHLLSGGEHQIDQEVQSCLKLILEKGDQK